MTPILYEPKNVSTYIWYEIGHLSDTIECKVTEERNGKFEMLLKYPISGAYYESITKRSIITAKYTRHKEPQPFRVYSISRPMNGIVTVKAQHISYDLSNIIVDPFEANSLSVALRQLTTDTVPICPFRIEFGGGVDSKAVFKNSVPSSVRSLLGGKKGSILDVYGGEWGWDKNKCYLYLNGRGRNNGVSIRYGKNLTDIRQEENFTNVLTGIYPYWKGSVQKEGQETGEEILVTLPEKIVNAPVKYDLKSNKVVDFSKDFQEPPTEDQLRKRAERYIKDNKVGYPKVSLKVSFAQLQNSEEYKDKEFLEQVNLCDTVYVSFPALGVKSSAKCIKTVYDCLLDRMDHVELGDARQTISDTIIDTQDSIKDVTESIFGKIPTLDAVRSVAMQVTAQILGARGGAVRLLDNDNDGTPDTLYIADNPDPLRAIKVWRWNYEGWGASKSGYDGPFEIAATLEQGLYADFITAGTLTANLLTSGTIVDKTGKNYWNLDTGEAQLNFTNLTIQGITPQSMADTAESNAKDAASGYASTAESNAKDAASGYASTAENNAKGAAQNYANTAENNAKGAAQNYANTAENNAKGAAKNYADAAETNAKNAAKGYADTAEANAAKEAARLIEVQTQTDIFNKLTNNGEAQGLYIRNGQLYISAEYIVAGLLRDRNSNFVLDLETGKVDIQRGNITLGPNDELKLSEDGSINAQKGNIGGFELSDHWLTSGGLYLIGAEYQDSKRGGTVAFRDDAKSETMSIEMNSDYDGVNGIYCDIVPISDFIVRCNPVGQGFPDIGPETDPWTLFAIRAGSERYDDRGTIEFVCPIVSHGHKAVDSVQYYLPNGKYLTFDNGILVDYN